MRVVAKIGTASITDDNGVIDRGAAAVAGRDHAADVCLPERRINQLPARWSTEPTATVSNGAGWVGWGLEVVGMGPIGWGRGTTDMGESCICASMLGSIEGAFEIM